jgi:hypothetical protein
MSADLNPEKGNKKTYTLNDRAGITIDPSMKDYSNDPFCLKQLAEAKRSFNKSGPDKKKNWM